MHHAPLRVRLASPTSLLSHEDEPMLGLAAAFYEMETKKSSTIPRNR